MYTTRKPKRSPASRSKPTPETADRSSRKGQVYLCPFLFVDAIHGDAAEQLRIEVGGFLRHDFAGGGNPHDQLDLDGGQQKRKLRGAAVDSLQSGKCFAFISEVCFRSHCTRCDAERRLENALMKQNDVELALQGGKARQDLRDVRFGTKRKDIKHA